MGWGGCGRGGEGGWDEEGVVGVWRVGGMGVG